MINSSFESFLVVLLCLENSHEDNAQDVLARLKFTAIEGWSFTTTVAWCEGFSNWHTEFWSFSCEICGLGIDINCPLWLPCLLSAATPLYYMTPICRRRKRRKLGLCVACGYDLRGSKERCPECGTGFSN